MRHILSALLLATTMFAATACVEDPDAGPDLDPDTDTDTDTDTAGASGSAIAADEPGDLELDGLNDPAYERAPATPTAEPTYDTLGARARARLDVLRRANLRK